MGRLKTMPGRLAAPARRLAAPAPGDEPARDRERRQRQPWRKWYATARWRKLRRSILERDGWTCQATGVPLIGKRDDPDAPVVDHIEEHKGDPVLFWSEANLQAVCKSWHDSEKQRQERSAAR